MRKGREPDMREERLADRKKSKESFGAEAICFPGRQCILSASSCHSMATATTRVLNLAELLDGILLYIHEDYKTLRSTSLVARNWRFGSQSLLLHSASLSNDRYPLFWEILEESSVMASNIVNFTFRSLGLVRFGHMKGLLVNLGRLPRLANLKVSGPFWDDDVEDTMIPQMALLNRLTIARSDFHTTRVLQALLAAWSSIGHLQIMRCHVRPGEVYEAARGSVTISKLETTCTHDSALSAIAAVLCVNSPRSLVATCRSLLQLHDLRKMLLRIGQNVHHFDMKFGPSEPPCLLISR